jgi:hypothetical protein
MPVSPPAAAERGSQKWPQAVAGSWESLDAPIIAHCGANSITWRSPLAAEAYAEYRDEAFLEKLGRADLAAALHVFWPRRGPQWDALGVTDAGDLLLVEAKAHVEELCSPGTAASASSRDQIDARLGEVAASLGARDARAAWSDVFYQLANRLAHLSFLREQGAPAYLVLVNFLNDSEMNGPTSEEVWRAAYHVAFHAMGLPKRHRLSSYIIEVFPDVRLGGRSA